MSVMTGTFDTVNSTGWAVLTGSGSLSFMTMVDSFDPMTSLFGQVTLSPLTVGSAGIFGSIRGVFTAVGSCTDTTVTASPRPVTLTSGGCDA